jgi:non-ribosomal peptide synthetase component F
MVFLAVFAVQLARYAGGTDLVIGTPVAGRERRETEGLIGIFINTLALRLDLAGEPTFEELLARVRVAALGAFAHQDLPFERIVEELRPGRQLERTPWIDVLFSLAGPLRAELPGLVTRAWELPAGEAQFDLSLAVTLDGARASTVLSYDPDRFDGTTVRRMAAHFATLLDAALSGPRRRLAELHLLTPGERQQVVVEWNDGELQSAGEGILTECFAAWARRTPDAVAVAGEDLALTYGELAGRARALAAHLRALGVRPEVRVGLFAERSPALVLGILAVLEAGGAYVPLDPTYPADRLGFLLADAAVEVLVTEGPLLARLPAAAGVTVARLDRPETWTVPPPAAASPACALSPQHPAYVIYTSGSTGRPKGVVVTHRNAVRLFTATEPWFGFGPADVWTLFHTSAGSASGRPTSGRSSTPTPSTSPSGRSGAPCSTVAGW